MASPLTDKFPPELRIRIYRQVLQFDSPLLIANKSYPEEPKVDVSLLLVSKQVYLEACDAFFEANTIRLWRRMELNRIVKMDGRCKADIKCIQHVRYLELVKVTDDSEWLEQKRLPKMIGTCLSFPKLKRLTIAYDSLKPWAAPTLADYLYPAVGGNLRCLGVGISKLGDDEYKEVFFKHYGMVRAWQSVKAAGELDAKRAIDEYTVDFRRSQGLGIWAMLDSMELPTWSAVYDLTRTPANVTDPHVQQLIHNYNHGLDFAGLRAFLPCFMLS